MASKDEMGSERKDSEGVVSNLRDVGDSVNRISGLPYLKRGFLFRSGAPGDVLLEALRPIRSVLSLTSNESSCFSGNEVFRVNCLPPPKDEQSVYEVGDARVRDWLKQGLESTFGSADFSWPLLIHCDQGKDRTGIFVATILLIAEVDAEYVLEEYELSDGKLKSDKMKRVLEIISNAPKYLDLNRQVVDKIRELVAD